MIRPIIDEAEVAAQSNELFKRCLREEQGKNRTEARGDKRPFLLAAKPVLSASCSNRIESRVKRAE